MQVLRPQDWNGELLPTLILVPGGFEGHTTDLKNRGGYGGYYPFQPEQVANAGFTVVGFDPDGRGQSNGEENAFGFVHQDGLAALIRAAVTVQGVDTSKIGVVSFSGGTTMAAGALARHVDLPAQFLIDLEGPAGDRYFFGCASPKSSWVKSCSDNGYWAEREVLNLLPNIRVPYQRIQSEIDHGPPGELGVYHAIRMINAAIKGGVPWTRLNSLPPNQIFNISTTIAEAPAMLPGSWYDQPLEELVIRYSEELFGLSESP